MDDHKKMNIEKLISKLRDRKKILIFSLLMIALISTFMVSYVMQNKVNQPVIDHIDVDPIEKRNFSLAGQILYTDKSPFSKGQVELHSEVKETKTDTKGWFLFQEVTPETHELKAYDDQRTELASATISLTQSDDKSILNIKKGKDDIYHIALSADTRYLELSIELTDKALIIHTDDSYAVSDEGKVYTKNGTLDIENGHIILPSGTVITEGNHIIHYPYVTKPDNSVIDIPKDGIILDDETKIDGDGTITLPNGTIIDKDGTVVDKNEEEYKPEDDALHVKPDGDVEVVKPTPPSKDDDANNENPSKPTNPETPVDPENPEDPDEPVNPDKPTDPEQPEEQEPNHDDPTFNVLGQIKNNVGLWSNPWRVDTVIDLFHNQSSGVSKYKNGVPLIQPGTSGYYLFQIENKRETTLALEIYIKETSYHLPLRYRLAPIENTDESLPQNLKWTDAVSLNKETVVKSSQIATKKTVLYRLEWEWPYDSGHDDVDTSAGIKGEKYNLNIGVGIQ